MEEKITELRLESEVGTLNLTGKENIGIEILDGKLLLKFNKDKLFSSLKDRKVIIAYLNKKLDELVDIHLTKMEEEERFRNEGI